MFALKTFAGSVSNACATHATFHTLNFPSWVSMRASCPGADIIGQVMSTARTAPRSVASSVCRLTSGYLMMSGSTRTPRNRVSLAGLGEGTKPVSVVIARRQI